MLSHLLYPRVYADYAAHETKYSDTSVLPTRVFFYGMEPGEEVSIDIEEGKTLIVKFLTVGDPQEDGQRLVFFELNGQPREVLVVDKTLVGKEGGPRKRPKASSIAPFLAGALPDAGGPVRARMPPLPMKNGATGVALLRATRIKDSDVSFPGKRCYRESRGRRGSTRPGREGGGRCEPAG